MISTVSNSSDDATGRGIAGSSRRNLVAAVFLCMTALFAPVPTHAHDTELYRFPPPWLMEGDCRRGNYVTSCLCSLAIEAAQARGWNPGRPEVGKCLRWAEELLLADPLVDEQRRNLSAQSWEAHVYPDKANLLMSTKIGVFSTLRECRGAAQRLIENEKWPAADYECGLNCQRTPGSDAPAVCEVTSR